MWTDAFIVNINGRKHSQTGKRSLQMCRAAFTEITIGSTRKECQFLEDVNIANIIQDM